MDKWIDDYNDVDFFENRTFEEFDAAISDEDRLKAYHNAGIFTVTKDVEWTTKNIHRTQGIQLMEHMGYYLRERDYGTLDADWDKSDMDIPFLRPKGYEQAMETHPTPPDRSRDPAEDFYRRLVTGPTSNSTFHRSIEFVDFYKACGTFYEEFTLWSGVLIIVVSLVGWIVVSIILLINLKRMRSFWKDILSVQVSFTPLNYILTNDRLIP
jgi:hypothetical protein